MYATPFSLILRLISCIANLEGSLISSMHLANIEIWNSAHGREAKETEGVFIGTLIGAKYVFQMSSSEEQ